MRNTAASQDRSLKIEPRRSFMLKISGHSRKQRFPFLILLNLSEVRINQILGRNDFSLRKFNLYSLVSLQTMMRMRMIVIKREADKNLGDDKNISWFIALLSALPREFAVLSQSGIHISESAVRKVRSTQLAMVAAGCVVLGFSFSF